MMTFEVKGLDALVKKCQNFGNEYPVLVNAFMQNESKKNIGMHKAAAPYTTFKKGYFVKTKKDGTIESWKAIKNKAPHLHLVNDGHRIVTRSGVDTGRKVMGKHWVEPVQKAFEQEFSRDIENFLKGNWEQIRV